MAIKDIIISTQEEKKLADNYTAILRLRNSLKGNAKIMLQHIATIEGCSNYLANASVEEKASIAKDKALVESILS